MFSWKEKGPVPQGQILQAYCPETDLFLKDNMPWIARCDKHSKITAVPREANVNISKPCVILRDFVFFPAKQNQCSALHKIFCAFHFLISNLSSLQPLTLDISMQACSAVVMKSVLLLLFVYWCLELQNTAKAFPNPHYSFCICKYCRERIHCKVPAIECSLL